MTVLVQTSPRAVPVPVADLVDSCSPEALVEALALAADIRAAAAAAVQVHVLDERG